MRLRIDSKFHLKDTDDIDDSDCYGFFGDFEQNAGLGQIGVEMGRITKKELEPYGEDTQEWEEAQLRYGKSKAKLEGGKLMNWF